MAKRTLPGRRAAIYARVSTDGQTTDNQLRELRRTARRSGWKVIHVYVEDGVSGAKGRDQRAEFDAMCKAAVRREFDVIMAWSVDRLGRSLQHLVQFLEELHATGVGLYLHQQGIDTTTPAGKAMFGMCGVFAEFERSIIQERIRSGLERAKEQGTKSGRPIGRPKVSNQVERKVRALRRKGLGIRKISRMAGVGVGTVQRIVTEMV